MDGGRATWGHSKKVAIGKPRTEASGGTWQHLDLGCPASRTVSKHLFVESAPSLWHLVLCFPRAQSLPSRLTLCDPRGGAPGAPQAPLSLGFSGKSTAAGGHALLQGIFPTQTCVSYVSSIGRRDLYHQHHLGSPSRLPQVTTKCPFSGTQVTRAPHRSVER